MSMEKLFRIQQAFHSPKDIDKPGIKFKFRNAENMLTLLKPILKEEECCIVFNEEVVNIGDRYYSRVETVISDSSGIVGSAVGYARESESSRIMSEGQLSGSTSSYAKKYSMQNLLFVDNNEDLDMVSGREKEAEEKETKSSIDEMKENKDTKDLATWFTGLEKSKQDAMRKRVGVYGKELKAKEAKNG